MWFGSSLKILELSKTDGETFHTVSQRLTLVDAYSLAL